MTDPDPAPRSETLADYEERLVRLETRRYEALKLHIEATNLGHPGAADYWLRYLDLCKQADLVRDGINVLLKQEARS